MPAHPQVTGHDGELIRQARELMVPAMSITRAAKITGDDSGNWGHTERGYQPLAGGGRRIIMHPPAPILARMSSVVGVTPEQWVARGRDDVAGLLRVILDERHREGAAVSAAIAGADDAFLRVIRASGLPREQQDEYTRLWHQGGREAVSEIARRMLRGLPA